MRLDYSIRKMQKLFTRTLTVKWPLFFLSWSHSVLVITRHSEVVLKVEATLGQDVSDKSPGVVQTYQDLPSCWKTKFQGITHFRTREKSNDYQIFSVPLFGATWVPAENFRDISEKCPRHLSRLQPHHNLAFKNQNRFPETKKTRSTSL